MVIVFYVILVWLKVIVGDSLALLWLWVARDRGVSGLRARLNAVAVLLAWAAPWAIFLIIQAYLFQGHCGLRQGVHDCGLAAFLWDRLRWVRAGLLLDICMIAGVFALMAASRVSHDESRALRAN